jgi:hypothetical protein
VRQRFEEHLENCDGCEAYLDQFRETIAVVGKLRPEHLSSPARAALLAVFRDWH